MGALKNLLRSTENLSGDQLSEIISWPNLDFKKKHQIYRTTLKFPII